MPTAIACPPLISGGAGINVILPMAGGSEDFFKAGYRFPKPLVNLVGRPMLCWLLDWLKLQPVDTVFLAVPRQMEAEHAIERRLRDEFPQVDFKFVLLEFATRGAAETLFAVLQHMSPHELARRTISLDCDNIYIADILSQFRGLPHGVSATWYFDDDGEHALYSYLRLADTPAVDSDEPKDSSSIPGVQFVHDVREKVAISNHANIGAYGFASGSELKAYCEAVIDASHSTSPVPLPASPMSMPKSPLSLLPEVDDVADETARRQAAANIVRKEGWQERRVQEAGGWYVSAVMRHMLHNGHRIVGLSLRCNDDFVDLGTPGHVREFLCAVRKGSIRLQTGRRMRFVFDLDGTLVTPPTHFGDYTSVEGIEQNISLVRSLKAAGHYIVIWTARESERLRGNVGAIMAAVGKVTFDTLDRLNIPYDELLFGKPAADAYIDHKAVNSRVDTQKELGWEVKDPPMHSQIAGSVAARAFNTVRPLDELHVVKTGPVHVMRGELHWYRNIPKELADLFPKPVEISDGGTHMASIVMTKVEGVPFTHLLVNLCLTATRLLSFLSSLTRMHRCTTARHRATAAEGSIEPESEHASQADTEDDDAPLSKSAYYANLHKKLVERYNSHRQLYQSFSVSELGFDLEEVVQPLTAALKRYEDADRACKAAFIHGDPVFSNVLMAKGGGIYLLDMRGALGDKLTTGGDVTYDLAKVYQSLCGYDFFLEDKELSVTSQQYLESLQRVFWSYVGVNYPEVSPADIRLITAQHFFAIVPLHEVRSRMALYLRTARALMLQESLVSSGGN